MHACLIVEGYDESAAKKLRGRYYRELKIGLIEKPEKFSPQAKTVLACANNTTLSK